MGELDGREPPVGICPLGTGNDLARSLGWGPVLKRVSDLDCYLKWAMAAEEVMLDRWRVALRPHGFLPEEHKLWTRLSSAVGRGWFCGVLSELLFLGHGCQ